MSTIFSILCYELWLELGPGLSQHITMWEPYPHMKTCTYGLLLNIFKLSETHPPPLPRVMASIPGTPLHECQEYHHLRLSCQNSMQLFPDRDDPDQDPNRNPPYLGSGRLRLFRCKPLGFHEKEVQQKWVASSLGLPHTDILGITKAL